MSPINSDVIVNIAFGIVSSFLATLGIVATLHSRVKRPHRSNDLSQVELGIRGLQMLLRVI